MANRNRFLIIGLDGFTWKLAESFFINGTMPFMAKLVKKGCHGNLHSVMPYETSPAWVSFQTGCNPGKTGVFAFHTLNKQNMEICLNSYLNIKVPTIWELADKAGKKVVSINMPVTSPPPDLENGIIIPGLLCPGLSPQTVSPPDAYNKYIKPIPDYTVVHKSTEDTDAEFIESSIKTLQGRREASLNIMADVDWDIFSVQIQSTDAFQHRFWNLLNPDNTSADTDLKTKALEFYRYCDNVIRDLVEAAGENTMTMIVSDHGFCSGRSSVSINVWLRQNGYLNLLPQKPITAWGKIKNCCPPLKSLAGLLGPLVKRSSEGGKKELFIKTIISHLRRIVDFNSTTAFCLGGMGGMLYINVPDSDKQKIAKEITDGLMKEFGPDSNVPVIEKILPAVKVYTNCADCKTMPDLVVYFADGAEHRITPTGEKIVFDKPLDGTHAKDGIFVASGKEVKQMLLDCDIIDIAPTVLSWIGTPVPNHMDGRVLKDIFTVEVNEVRQDMTGVPKGKTEYSDAEQSSVEKQLKDLGYL
ncbi:MAG: hypothetical protein FVQ82_14890 [Planctomycetes bacterium]|nr:hypothetical protein [Planctomycetota bacterium]